MPTLSVLTVCSMNICRSPAAEVLLRRGFVSAAPTFSLSVGSAGCAEAAGLGAARCDFAQAHVGVTEPVGRSRLISRELLSDVDLILAADRSHIARVVALVPEARERSFTLLEAARLATWVVGDDGVFDLARRKGDGRAPDLAPDDLRSLVEPLPAGSDPAERTGWLISEMGAARGLTPRRDHRFAHLRIESLGPDDLPDPHVVGMGLHSPVVAEMRQAVDELVAAITLVAQSTAKADAPVGVDDDV